MVQVTGNLRLQLQHSNMRQLCVKCLFTGSRRTTHTHTLNTHAQNARYSRRNETNTSNRLGGFQRTECISRLAIFSWNWNLIGLEIYERWKTTKRGQKPHKCELRNFVFNIDHSYYVCTTTILFQNSCPRLAMQCPGNM